MWAHAAVSASVERVKVSRLSVENKLPFVLQLRASENMKKGSLILAPAYGHILLHGADAATDLERARSQGTVHASMLSHVDVKVAMVSTVRRKK